MIRALYSAASGMTAQQMSIDTIANNLANANTAGYKARRTQFQDLLYQNVVQPGTSAGSQTIVPNGLQLGLGTRPSTNTIIFTQGSFQETDNPLDMVIQGKGFFQIKLPSGTIAYTRAGNFQMDATGNIVDSNGNAMQPQINIPAASQSVAIAADGTVSYTLPNQSASQVAGTDSAREFHQSRRIERRSAAGISNLPMPAAKRSSASPAVRKASAHSSRATRKIPTSAWWKSSST